MFAGRLIVRPSLNTYRPIIPVLMEHSWSFQALCDQHSTACQTKWKEEVLLKENTNKRDADSIIEQNKRGKKKKKTQKVQEHLIVKHFTCCKKAFYEHVSCVYFILFYRGICVNLILWLRSFRRVKLLTGLKSSGSGKYLGFR